MVDNITRRDALHALAAGPVAGLAGCSELVGGSDGRSWPQYGGGPAHTARTGALGDAPELLWTYDYREDGDDGDEYRPTATTPPIVTGDGLAVADPWHTHRIDDAGERRWRVQHREPTDTGYVSGTLARVGDAVVVPYTLGLHSRTLSGGSVGWTTDLDGYGGEPLVVDGDCYLAADGDCYRLDAGSGEVLAARRGGEPGLRALTGGADDVVAVGTYRDDDADPPVRGVVAGLDPADLSTSWTAEVGGVRRFGSPTVADGVAYVPAGHQPNDGSSLVAVGTADGAVLWRAPVGDLPCASVAAGEDGVFVANWRGDVLGFDAATGEERWRTTVDSPAPAAVRGSPLLAGNTVVVPVQEQGLVAFDAGTGEERWSFAVDVGRYGPVSDGDRLYVADDAVYAVALD